MALTPTQQERIAYFIPAFKEYLRSTACEADVKERQERTEAYKRLLSPEGLLTLGELEFGQVISSLWASLMWGNKGYLVDQLLADNPLPELKKHLYQLIWGSEPVAKRYNSFRTAIKGFGAATITELLAFVHPQECGVWNTKARKGLILLGFQETFPLVKDSQISGNQYEQFNAVLGELSNQVHKYDLPELDLLGINYFLFEVWNRGREYSDSVPEVPEEVTAGITDFDHDDIIDQILTLGQWLGFNVDKEKPIAPGARVDAVWQAQIANLGVVTYVFEVQRHGSHDSLILNLQRAQNNPTVQRLVVVGMDKELKKVEKEIGSLHESFRRMVTFMDVTDVMRGVELVTELSGIINRLELVKSEFGS
jgi:hypothetical protein